MAASNYAHYRGCGYKSFTITRICLGKKNQAFLFSLSVGMIPTVLYFTVGLVIRKRRGKSRNTEMRANKVTESRFLIMLPALA
ncbi:hypothetical protein HMPREF9393_1579 [Streptococcus sanguinis SK1056]|uniref:Uncharacterized protein n=1 Tax=Streptococcus sanguinis SK1056 TaxID=888820 RepID=F3UDH2_STRSA|nr:hypothetical protein HMPREF9393_1579 [Streptococcus sanguinis SK1056]